MAVCNVRQDFQRDVVCLLGIPFDVIQLTGVVNKINESALKSNRCIISTPNVNFVIKAQADNAFLSSVINSDLNIVDGMPLVWISKLLGLPLQERVAGSDLLDFLYLKQKEPVTQVFFFGGEDGVAEKAAHIVNSKKLGLYVNDFFDPGFTSVENMSTPEIINKLNASNADFLILALGAEKGQLWIEHNKSKINIPVISHLGAALNFITGNVKRSPVFFQKTGLEWLWRIYQEPFLWKRYFQDARKLSILFFFRVLPYYFWLRKKVEVLDTSFEYTVSDGEEGFQKVLVLSCKGEMTIKSIDTIADVFYQAYQVGANVVIDFGAVTDIDAFAIGKLLILKKHQDASQLSLELVHLSDKVRKICYWNCVDHIL